MKFIGPYKCDLRKSTKTVQLKIEYNFSNVFICQTLSNSPPFPFFRSKSSKKSYECPLCLEIKTAWINLLELFLQLLLSSFIFYSFPKEKMSSI